MLWGRTHVRRCSEGLRMIQDFLGMPRDLFLSEVALPPALCEQKRVELLLYKLLNQFDSPASKLKVRRRSETRGGSRANSCAAGSHPGSRSGTGRLLRGSPGDAAVVVGVRLGALVLDRRSRPSPVWLLPASAHARLRRGPRPRSRRGYADEEDVDAPHASPGASSVP